MTIKKAMVSLRSMRRSRSPALALARESGPPLDRKVDPTPDRARIEVLCLHKLLGIAPQKLLFHANVKNDSISSLLMEFLFQSTVLTKSKVCGGRHALIARYFNSVGATGLAPHRQKIVTLNARKSPIFRKAGR